MAENKPMERNGVLQLVEINLTCFKLWWRTLTKSTLNSSIINPSVKTASHCVIRKQKIDIQTDARK